jgi:hypothetical protein
MPSSLSPPVRLLAFATAAGLLVLGCATAEPSNRPDGGDNGGGDGGADAGNTAPDASPGTPVQITISHSMSQVITAGNSVACVNEADQFHSDNSYYRVFDLQSFGVTGPLQVSMVQFGVEQATGAAGSQPAVVRLHTLTGTVLSTANLSLLSTANPTITDQSTSILDVPVTAMVPAGSRLVVELNTPDAQTVGHSFFIGSNEGGQTGPSYLRAPDCGVNEPTDTTGLGFPNMHVVMNVIGTHTP